MLCPHCGTENQDGASLCSHCEEPLSEQKEAQKPELGSYTITSAPLFSEEDFDSTASHSQTASDIDYSQFKVVSEGANSSFTKEERKPNEMVRTVLVVLLALILCAGIGTGILTCTGTQQDNARRAGIKKLENTYKTQIEDIDVSPDENSDRAELLASYQELADIQNTIDNDVSAGKFKLNNGADDKDLTVVTSMISDKEQLITDWFSSDYKKRLSASSFSESDSAETLDESAINTRLDELKALRDDLENEKIVWGDKTGRGSDYDTYIHRITEQTSRGNVLKRDLQRKAQEKAEKERNANKSTKKAQTKWVGNENSSQISFNGKVSSISEPFTITSSDGGKHIAVSSTNAAWHTDYLEKQ